MNRKLEDLEIAEFQVKMEPDSPEAHCALGIASAVCGDFAKAIAALETALRFKPNYAEAAHTLGSIFFDLEMYREAEAAFTRIKGIEVFEGLRSAGLAEVYRKTGRLKLARDHYFAAINSSVRLNPILHRGLTDLLLQGVDLDFQKPARPILDRRLQLTIERCPLYFRLRIFKDQLQSDRKVVIFTTEAADAKEKRVGRSVVNGAEYLVEYILNRSEFAITFEQSTFVTMIETDSALGPMTISRLKVSAERATKAKGIAPRQKFHVRDVEFENLSHKRLEELVRCRFDWTPRTPVRS